PMTASSMVSFFTSTPTTPTSTLSLHDALPISLRREFPAADFEVTHRWGGPLAVPRDWSMSVRLDRQTGIGSAGGYTGHGVDPIPDRKSTRLNSSHVAISYAVFCLKKKKYSEET